MGGGELISLPDTASHRTDRLKGITLKQVASNGYSDAAQAQHKPCLQDAARFRSDSERSACQQR